MDIKHSDGPWGISLQSPRTIKQFDCHGESNVIIGSACGYTGSGFFPSDEEAIVNARIMGASLDLLEALRELLECCVLGNSDGVDEDRIDSAEQSARAAIAKATGAQS